MNTKLFFFPFLLLLLVATLSTSCEHESVDEEVQNYEHETIQELGAVEPSEYQGYDRYNSDD